MWPFEELDIRCTGLGGIALREGEHLVGHVHANARPVGPTRYAEGGEDVVPAPDPRSRTRSPSCRSATAVGLPQPSDAMTAASGSSLRSSAE